MENQESFYSKHKDSLSAIVFWSIILITTLIVLSYLVLPTYESGSYRTVCNDGSISQSKGPGSCSHHGGVNYYDTPDTNIIYSGFWEMIKGLIPSLYERGFWSSCLSFIHAFFLSLIGCLFIFIALMGIYTLIKKLIGLPLD